MITKDILKTVPYPYQLEGIKFMLSRNRVLLFDELGLGKTLQTIATVIIMKNEGRTNKCLVLTPATLKRVWGKEITKHSHEKYIIIEGSKIQRRQQYKEFQDTDTLFLIMNYDLLRYDINILETLLIDTCVADEVVYIKSSKSKRTKALKKLHFQNRIGISGYPIANNPIDIWSQVDWIKPGYLSNFWAFQDRYTIKKPIQLKTGREFNMVVAYRNLDELRQRLNPIYIRRLKSEVFKDLPPKIYETRDIEMSSEQWSKYIEMRDEMRVLIAEMSDEDVMVKARNLLVRFLRLSQLSGGFITDATLDGPIWLKDKDNAKLQVVDELLEEITSDNGKVVIWSRFRPVVFKLFERYKEKYNAVCISGSVSMDDRQLAIDRFQDDEKTKVFVGQVQSGGIGITLTRANVEIFYDKAFVSPSTIVQAEGRCHRISLQHPIVIISLIASKTVDEHWEQLIIKKRKMAEELLGDVPGVNITKTDLQELLI